MAVPFVARIDLYPIKGVRRRRGRVGDRPAVRRAGRGPALGVRRRPGPVRQRQAVSGHPSHPHADRSRRLDGGLRRPALPAGRRRDAARGLGVGAARHAGAPAREPDRRLSRRHRRARADADRDRDARSGRRLVRPDARAGAGPLPRQHRDRRRAGVLGGRVLRRHLPHRRRRGRRGAGRRADHGQPVRPLRRAVARRAHRRADRRLPEALRRAAAGRAGARRRRDAVRPLLPPGREHAPGAGIDRRRDPRRRCDPARRDRAAVLAATGEPISC